MKKTYFSIVILICICALFSCNKESSVNSVQQKGWFQQNSNTKNILLSVFFTNTNTGFIVGSSGLILKTTNSGSSWTIKNSGTTNLLRSIFFLDSNTGYAVGDGGVILKSSNAGETWTLMNSLSSTNLYSIYFIDSEKGFAVGQDGVILKTVNAGTSWTLQTIGSTSNFYSIQFTDSLTGFLIDGKNIYKTIDGGSNWVSKYQNIQYNNYQFSAAYFIDNNYGYVTCGSPEDMNSLLLKTNDGGENWSVMNVPHNLSASLFFTDSNTGYVCAYRSILRTNDGGSTWTTQFSASDFLTSVFFVSDEIGFTVGSNGVILKTFGGGQ